MAMAFPFMLLNLVLVLFIVLLPIALLVALQVWLCRRGRWLGLILPGISLVLSLLMVFSMGAFTTLTVSGGNTHSVGGGANYIGPDGQEVPAQEEYIEVPAQEGTPKAKTEFHPRALVGIGVVFLVTNIPTVVFGGIWLHYKGRRDTLDDLKKMRIEDLE